ncbi:MAG: hypothetical protein KC731_20095 [Myxococcales bacterium]|nr:hypothetical protein [Myxococcales bacterium]
MSDRSEDHRRDQVHRFTLAGYRDAARWAGRGGELGIVFNHSSPLSLHLAPGGWLQIYRQTLERIHRSREREAEGGGDGDRELSLGDLVVSRIGDVLYGGPDQPARRPAVGSRTTPFIRRVNLLSCSVGVGEIGQAFLDWLQVVWGVPVRGLRGTLTLTQAGVDPIRSFVAPADSLNLSRAEREEFLEPRLNDPHMHPALWATSRDVVPTSTP